MESPFASAARSSLPPPSYVRYVPQGPIRTAARVARSPHAPAKRASAAQKAGLRFQARVRDWAFRGTFSGTISEGPWFSYEDSSSGLHFCQPDFLFDGSGVLVVVEAKRTFSADAWWQLQKLYVPVLHKVRPGALVVPLCVCKSFDPHTVIPEPVNLVQDLMDCKPGRFNVLVLP